MRTASDTTLFTCLIPVCDRRSLKGSIHASYWRRVHNSVDRERLSLLNVTFAFLTESIKIISSKASILLLSGWGNPHAMLLHVFNRVLIKDLLANVGNLLTRKYIKTSHSCSHLAVLHPNGRPDVHNASPFNSWHQIKILKYNGVLTSLLSHLLVKVLHGTGGVQGRIVRIFGVILYLIDNRILTGLFSKVLVSTYFVCLV